MPLRNIHYKNFFHVFFYLVNFLYIIIYILFLLSSNNDSKLALLVNFNILNLVTNISFKETYVIIRTIENLIKKTIFYFIFFVLI